MYTLFVKLAQFLNSQQEFLTSWLFWTVSFFRHPFIMWPFPLMTYGAFVGSALLQAFSYPGWRIRTLTHPGADRPSVLSAVALGITGPPDWRSNLDTFQHLLRRKVPPATAFAYLISSYNLTIYFFLLIMVNNGPQIILGQVIAVLLMIAFVQVGFSWFIPQAMWAQAPSGAADGPPVEVAGAAQAWKARITSPRGWLGALGYLLRDVKVLVIPILIGVFIGGFVAAWGYTDSFFDLRLGGGVLGQLLNAVIGPILGIVTFMVPVLNIFVASWLWKTDFLAYAGLVGFFLATVLHPDAVGAYRRLFGRALTLRIVLILLGAVALAALLVTAMWYVLAGLASLFGVRTFIERSILTSSITPSPVPWFHELLRPTIAAYMKDVVGGMPGAMGGGMQGM
jgi:uncharacterized membrane protein YraQ (UPF0718 family)